MWADVSRIALPRAAHRGGWQARAEAVQMSGRPRAIRPSSIAGCPPSVVASREETAHGEVQCVVVDPEDALHGRVHRRSSVAALVDLMDLASRLLAEAGHLGGAPDRRVPVLLWVRGVIRQAKAT
eukprot:1240754-Pyramimonas_sp.AAC.1